MRFLTTWEHGYYAELVDFTNGGRILDNRAAETFDGIRAVANGWHAGLKAQGYALAPDFGGKETRTERTVYYRGPDGIRYIGLELMHAPGCDCRECRPRPRTAGDADWDQFLAAVDRSD